MDREKGQAYSAINDIRSPSRNRRVGVTTAAAPVGTVEVVDDGRDEDGALKFPMLSLGVGAGVGVDSVDEVIVDESCASELEVVCASEVDEGWPVSPVEEDSSIEVGGSSAREVEVSSTGVVVTGTVSPTVNVGSGPPEK